MTTLHLIGSGPGKMRVTQALIGAALDELGLEKPRVAYVGVASGDAAFFFRMIEKLFKRLGARLELVPLARKNANLARARRLLDDADVVFMSGGDVHHGMELLRARKMDRHLVALAAAGKPFIGISAGSIMCGTKWVHFPDEDDDTRATAFDCLGIAPVIMDAHEEQEDWSELRRLLDLLGKKAIGYGLVSNGCLRVETGPRPKLAALGAPIVRLCRVGKSVRKLAPLAPAKRPRRR